MGVSATGGQGARYRLWTAPQRVALALVVLATAAALARGIRHAPEAPQPPRLQVDPNTAPEGVLLVLPRIGPARAGAIVDERRRGPFLSAQDLSQRVSGVGPVTIEQIGPYLQFPDGANLAVGGSRPSVAEVADSGPARH